MYVGDDEDPRTVRLPRDVETARRLVARIRKGRDARSQMIGKLRAAIQHGDYENDLKLSVAIDRLLEENDSLAPGSSVPPLQH